MKKEDFMASLTELRALAKKRKFDQTIDLTVNFKNVDFKKPENRLDLDVTLPHKSKDKKIAAFVKDKQMAQILEGKVAKVYFDAEIPNFSKKDVKKLANEYDVFIAEPAVMVLVGKHLGQVLGPRGKMPKIVPANEKAINTLLPNFQKIANFNNKRGKNMPVVHAAVALESMSDDQVIDNLMAAFNSIVGKIDGGEGNIRSVFIKMSMSPALEVGGAKK